MYPVFFFIVTAVVEVGAGACLLLLPSVVFELLLGVNHPSPEAILVGQVAGAALLAIGVASWAGRNAERGSARNGLLAGLFIYNASAVGLFVYAGGLNMVGIALWPAVVLHTVMGSWCVVCLWQKPSSSVRSD